jgi:hypothetical protein
MQISSFAMSAEVQDCATWRQERVQSKACGVTVAELGCEEAGLGLLGCFRC